MLCRTFCVYCFLLTLSILFSVIQEIQGYGTTTRPGFAGTTGIRLVDSYDEYNGIVELQVNGEWRPICGYDLGSNEATVICRQLGYGGFLDFDTEPGDTYKYDGFFYLGLSCGGHENNIDECTYSDLRGSTQAQCGYSLTYTVGRVKCAPRTGSGSASGFNFLGWIVFVFFFMVILGIFRQRYRRRNQGGCWGGRGPTHQTTVVTANNGQGVVIPPPTTTSYPAPAAGTYPTQPQANQYSPAADLPPQYNSIIPPKDGVAPYPQSSPYPPQGNSAPYPPQGGGAPYPPQGSGAPYPPQGGGAPYPLQGSGVPYPPQGGGVPYQTQGGAAPYPPPGGAPYVPNQPSAPGQPTDPAYAPPYNPVFPPSDYTPTANDSEPHMPPPSYESIATGDSGGGGQTGTGTATDGGNN